MPKAKHHRKFRQPNLAEPGSLLRDPQITEQAYELLARGTSQQDLLTAITPVSAALHSARPAPAVHKFKLRGPLKDQIPELDAFLAQGFAAGRTLVQMMAQILPSIDDERAAKRERIRADNEAKTAKRLAHRAALNDPDKRERERQRFQAKLRATAASNAARDRRLERKAAKRAADLAENPTLTWRTPRRKGWTPT